ncbi:DUF559 domain-containing protein [Luteimonas sp. SX5]|uniref:DUF559 domain-containing protein n=1 Tax=Luteimonas galliterrae TaxID=2940486 RepID=A0ABT0MIJ4_9GAMM|nr:DUF559 domain-containing protein [Luteimonas galliterrae]MCL1634680.1 DUF559 domain-containing protein [Luteimonas galliterrae]
MPKIIKPPLPTRSLTNSRRLRREQTDAERELWQRLRGAQIAARKFRRQHPIPPYIADFCCIETKLIIELDGSQHSAESDAARTRFLEAGGWKLIRFWDSDVLLNIDGVLDAIWNAVGPRTLTPTPLPEGEGLKEQKP